MCLCFCAFCKSLLRGESGRPKILGAYSVKLNTLGVHQEIVIAHTYTRVYDGTIVTAPIFFLNWKNTHRSFGNQKSCR